MSENKTINKTEVVDKPIDWPVNGREARLSMILDAVNKFINNPNHTNKEILISLVSQVDLNEHNSFGQHRVTKYEVALINELYMLASYIMFYDLKIFLYQQVYYTTRQQKIIHQMFEDVESLEVKEYKFLFKPLKLFYLVYANFNLKKTRSFPDQLIHEINLIKKESPLDEIPLLLWTLNNLLIDLSWFSSTKVFSILKWSRQDIQKVFEIQANLMKQINQNALISPLKGVLCITISNWILKSRNGYNEDFLIKYLPDSINLNEIWMQAIKYLNDKREQTVIKELYKTKDWIKFEWARKIDLEQKRTTYVSSFSKASINSEMQKEYGKNIYGYKSDRIKSLISPINFVTTKRPRFGHVICYDIIYDINKAKEEINFLCEIIDLYDLRLEEKNAFLNELIQYWILSFKDKKWEYEKERRYQVMIYSDLDYTELKIDEKYLKISSWLFTFPDFISKNNNNKDYLKFNRMDKLAALSEREYVFCDDCLQADYDNLHSLDEKKKCPICGSNKIRTIKNK